VPELIIPGNYFLPMAFIYTVTFRSAMPGDPEKFLKLQLVATDQVKALNLATEKAAELRLKVTRLEEIQALHILPKNVNMFFTNGIEFSVQSAF
jgi:hypothetical protein